MKNKSVIRDWEMSIKTRPDRIEDMALAPSIKHLLQTHKTSKVKQYCLCDFIDCH